MDTTMTILYGITYGIAIALIWIGIIELVSRYLERKRLKQMAMEDKKIKKELEEIKARTLREKIKKLPRKIKLKKILIYAVSGNFVKTFKAKYDPLTNIARFKGIEVYTDPQHFTVINGKLGVFVDLDKRRSIEPPYVEPSMETKKQEIASHILTWYYSLTGLRKRAERLEIMAFVIMIIAMVIVFAMYYIYTIKMTESINTLNNIVENIRKSFEIVRAPPFNTTTIGGK